MRRGLRDSEQANLPTPVQQRQLSSNFNPREEFQTPETVLLETSRP